MQKKETATKKTVESDLPSSFQEDAGKEPMENTNEEQLREADLDDKMPAGDAGPEDRD